jgi:nucleoside-diphosphate-sugar epimerase
MKTLISGATGFIGSHLSSQLSDLGHLVIPISQAQLYEPIELQKLFDKHQPDYIFHLASYGNHSNQTDVPMTVFSNIIGTFNMLSASNNINYKKFVQISTSSVNLPIETFYSASKAGAERIANAFKIQNKKPIMIVRPYSIFGENEASFRFIPTICRSIIRGEEMELVPNSRHDWIYVTDFVTVLLENLDKDMLEIGSGVSYTNKQIVEMLEEISSSKARIKEVAKLRSYDTDNWTAKEANIRTPLKEALTNTYKYYEQLYKN